MVTDRERLILLNCVPDVGPVQVRRLLDAFGGIKALCAASDAQLRRVWGIGPVIARKFVSTCRTPGLVEEEMRLARRHGRVAVLLTVRNDLIQGFRQRHIQPERGQLPVE